MNMAERDDGRLGDASARLSVEAIPTGCLAVDLALGIGGIPRGRITEIFGNESSGKTLLALNAVGEAQRRGGVAAFIDAEHGLDPDWARLVGVNVDDLLISQPDTGEQALDITDLLVRSGAVDILVVDSVAALVPRAELEGEMGDSQVGLQARLMSKALRKLAGSISKSRAAAVFINQVREKVGIMFGNPEVTPGGRALKFWSAVRIELRRVESIKQGTEVVGIRSRAKIVKSKVAPPYRQAEFDIYHGEGISKSASVLDVGLAVNVITKSGAFFSYQDTRLGQGRDNAREFLDANPEIAREIESKIRELTGPSPSADAEAEAL
ncbi:recombinase RecA [candidate division KD3-62 bacterium DG_56]|uniref:Protein RecA n=1 Tax=candidate division KD3-62 bacterium DG_56 TaxID=1704032 RepID=A0A0S7XMS8_9BACT|nr:MAG: recombinase RecA [candidate division KD3-62 bacterium DG_56]